MSKFLQRVMVLGATFLLTTTLFAQQVTNANFEDWSGTAFNGEIQPKGWNASNVEQVGMKFNFAHRETGHNGGYCMMVQDQSVGAMGITETSPGYFSIGQPWAYLPSITQINQATAGTSGGQSNWHYRPDTMSVWIKRTGSNWDKEDFYLLYYAWEKQAQGTSYKGKNTSCTSHSETNEESDIRIAMNGNECKTTVAGDQVCEGMWRERANYNNWTQIKVPIYYFNNNTPNFMNIIFSASNYPNFRANNGLYEGNSLYVDDVQLIYSSKVHKLVIGDKEWKGFDPNSSDIQIYSLGTDATSIPVIKAYRGAGSLTNAKGTTKSFPGRELSGSEITINYQPSLESSTPTTITVRAEDGSSTTTYKVLFQKAASSNAKLASISVNGEPITGFSATKYNYQYKLPYGTTAAPVVDAEKQEDKQTVNIKQATSVNGTATITVKAADNTTTQNYTVSFEVGLLADNELQDIQVNGTSIPGFTPSQTIYKVSLPTTTDKVPTVTYTSKYAPGEQTVEIILPTFENLNGGQGLVKVTTPGNQIAKVYKLNFKLEESSYTYLQDLKVGGVTVTDFAPDYFTYYINLPLGTTAIPAVTFTKGDKDQTVEISSLGAGVLDGTVRVTVTAANGDQSVYKLVFATEKSDRSTLNGINIGGVALAGFDPDVTSYTYALPVGTSTLPEITVVPGDEFQTYAITTAGLNGKTRITVTAGDGSTTIYTISFSVETFSENTLASLSVAGFDIGFNPEVNEYWVNLPQGTTTLPAVTYTLVDPNFQSASVRTISGLTGDYKITVRPQSGASRTYIIHFSVATSSNVNLNMIYVGGTPLEGFNTNTTAYTVTLPEGVSKIPAVTFDKAESTQRVLSVLDGKIQTITVTAQSGATRTYTITFIVTVSQNAFLNMIYLDSVALDGFEPQTLTYEKYLEGTTCPSITVDKAAGQQVTITAPYAAGVAQIKVQPEEGAANIYEITFKLGAVATARLAGIQINGVDLAGFAATTLDYQGITYVGSLPVVEGVPMDANQTLQTLWKGETAYIHVTDAEGNKAVYSVAFTRQMQSNKALQAILVDGTPLSGFDPAVLDYSRTLPAGSTYPEVNYIADDKAQVVFFGQVADGKWAITVMAEDGSMSTYSIQFTISKYDDATLTNLLLNGVAIEGFAPNITNYAKVIDEGAELPTLTVETREGQTVLITNKDDKHQQVIVYAESGATKTYTVTYTRTESNNALLSDILINGVSIAGFDPLTTNYEDSIAWRSPFVPNVFPIGQLPNQTITTYFCRPDGTTKIHVVAQNGITTKDYFVSFPVRKSNNTKLGDLYLDTEDAELNFKANTTDYEVRLPYSATICPQMVFEKDEPEQRIDVISRPISQTSQIIVTAENGDTRTYNITFKREVLKTKNLLQALRVRIDNNDELEQELSLKDKTQRNFDVNVPYGSRILTIDYEKSYKEQTVFIQPGGVHAPTIITVKANNDTIADEVYTVTPILGENNPAVLTAMTLNGSPLPGFNPYKYSYIVPVENKHIIRYTVNKGAEINILEQNEKHWQAEVTYGSIVTTYDLWFYYTNDVLPNTEFSNWENAAKKGRKPIGWNTLGQFTEGYSSFWGTYTTGNEVTEATEGGEKCVKMESKYNSFPLGGFVPAYITLGTINADFSVAAGSDFSVSGGVTFRNSPDQLTVNFKQTAISNNKSRIVYQMSGSLSNQEKVYTNTGTHSTFQTVTLDLRETNELAGIPQTMNVILNSFESEAGRNGTEASSATMFVNWARFSFNHTLTGLKVDEFTATKSGNAFAATLTDPERIELPVLKFTGEVADQAQDVTWDVPTKDADFETRTATIRNWAENGTDYTDYTLTVKRPLDTNNELANLLMDTVMITGFSSSKTSYTINIPKTRRNLPDIQPIPGSSLQQVTTVFNPADTIVTITVTPEKGAQKVYTVHFTSSLSNDVTLASITADGLTYDPTQTTYELAADHMPIISFVKRSDLQVVSLNNGVISVTAEDGTQGTYTITRVDPVIAPNGTIDEFEDKKGNVLTDLGGTTYDKEGAKPEKEDFYISFTRVQNTDSVIFVQSETQMQWYVPGSGKAYTWTYPMTASDNANLAAITVEGTNYADFLPGETDYELISDTTLVLAAIGAEEKQVITTSYNPIAAGVEYTAVVKAENGATKTYTVRVMRSKSDYAMLEAIMLDGDTVSGFNPANESYNVILPLPADGVKRVQPQMPNITYVAGHKGQTVTVEPGTLGNPTNFTVISEDGTNTKYYDLTISAEESHCVDLTGITVNGTALDHFEPGRHFYSLSVKTSDITVDYTSDDQFQTIRIKDTTIVDGHEVHYTLYVTAEDGVTTSEYLVEIYIENQSNDRTLANITLDGKDFVDFERALNEDLTFDPDNNNYIINLPSGTTILPEVNAQLKMDGQTVVIDQQGDSVLLNVTAVDGSTNQYVLHFVVPLSKNANLSMIFLNGETLPGFDPEYYFYQIDLPVGTHELPEVNAQKAEEAQTILPIEIDTDKLQATIKVQAEDHAARENTYVVVFHFTQSDADTLAMIYQDGQALEGFQPQNKYYTLSLPVGTTTFPDLSWEEADDWQTVYMDTVESTQDKLIRQIIVISESGKKNTYTVSYTIEKSDIDFLSMIFVDQRELPNFDYNTLEYWYELTASYAAELNGQLPIVEYISGDDYQTVLVSQVRDSLEGKSLGYMSIITVTAATGSSRTYRIHYPVQKSSEATLNMINLAGKPLANYDSERFNYRVEIDKNADVPVVTVLKKEEEQIVEINIDAEADVVTVVVTAEDGVTQAIYTLTFERVQSAVTRLTDIILRDEDGIQFPSEKFPFRYDVYSYTINIPYTAEKTAEEQLPSVEVYTYDPMQTYDTVHYTLENGDIRVDVTVTAPDGENQAIYSLVFHFMKPTDATLVNILINDEELPGFLPLLTDYEYAHPFGSDSTVFFTAAEVEALLSDSLATLTITDNEFGTIFIRVIAQDGITEITYTITQIIAKDNDCLLSAILLDGDTISGFDSEITFYTYFLRMGSTTTPLVEGIPHSENADVSYNVYSAGDTCMIIVTADDGTEKRYYVHFAISSIDETLEPTAEDVVIKRIPGTYQLFVGTIRRDVYFALFDHHGHRLFFDKVPTADPNDTEMVPDLEHDERLNDIYNTRSGLLVDVEPNQIYFYTFLYGDKTIIQMLKGEDAKKLKYGKIMCY